MFKKCLAMFLAVALLIAGVTLLSPPKVVEAGPTKIIHTTVHWEEVTEDGTICRSGSYVAITREESWWHRLCFWCHPHGTKRAVRTVWESWLVDDC